MRHLLSVTVFTMGFFWLPVGWSAEAGQFGGWRFTPPAGWTQSTGGDYISFEKITGSSFCQLALYEARAAAGTSEQEADFEWANVVEKTFSAGDKQTLASGKTRSALAYGATAAPITDGSGNSYYAILYVVTPANLASSVLTISNTPETMTQCRASVSTFLDSLSVAGGTSQGAASTTSRPPSSTTPVVGRWAASASARNMLGYSMGSIKREYVFSADGSYRFHMEAWGGHMRSDEWTLVQEQGNYTIAGNQLTVQPATAKMTVRGEAGVRGTQSVPLEKTTYS